MLKKNADKVMAIVCAIVFGTIGFWGDRAFIRYELFNERAINYDFSVGEEDNIELIYSVNFPNKVNMVDLNGFVRNIFHQPEMNGVTKLNNGYLTVCMEELDSDVIKDYADEIVQYNDYCLDKGVKLLYIQPAYKISKFDDQLPIGDEDYSNVIIDELLSEIKKGGVSTIDLRQEMFNDGINQYDYYYKTDHHWTTEGAFYAYCKIVEWISDNTGTTYDKKLTDLNNYKIDTYKKWHLGMRGQRTGKYFAGIDDFDLIHPDFETIIINRTDGTTGSFDEMIINWDKFSATSPQDRSTYDGAYTKNHINDIQAINADTDLTVLMQSDSFSRAVSPYMLLTYENYYEAGGYRSLSADLIDQYEPDVVVIMPWPGYFYEPGVFEFSL